MFDLNFILANPARFESILGISYELFRQLLPDFDRALFEVLKKNTLTGKPRNIKFRFRNQTFQTPELRLAFILYALKNNSLQQNISMAFRICQSTVSRYYPLFLHALLIALKPYAPCLDAKQLAQNPDLLKQTLIIDGTERPVERNTWAQEEYYSGEKKRHTIKNVILVTLTGFILWRSPTYGGRYHDKTIADDGGLPPELRFLADLGFLGIQKEHEKAILPEKKPKGKELTEEQKLYNHNHASIRVIVEHVIASIKTLRVLKDTCRLRSDIIKDQVFQVGCALHNFKLSAKLGKMMKSCA